MRRYALFAVIIEMLVAGLTLPVAPAFAHHSVSAEFDLSKRITLEAVSYTHLDVYKRQAMTYVVCS